MSRPMVKKLQSLPRELELHCVGEYCLEAYNPTATDIQ